MVRGKGVGGRWTMTQSPSSTYMAVQGVRAGGGGGGLRLHGE